MSDSLRPALQSERVSMWAEMRNIRMKKVSKEGMQDECFFFVYVYVCMQTYIHIIHAIHEPVRIEIQCAACAWLNNEDRA